MKIFWLKQLKPFFNFYDKKSHVLYDFQVFFRKRKIFSLKLSDIRLPFRPLETQTKSPGDPLLIREILLRFFPLLPSKYFKFSPEKQTTHQKFFKLICYHLIPSYLCENFQRLNLRWENFPTLNFQNSSALD